MKKSYVLIVTLFSIICQSFAQNLSSRDLLKKKIEEEKEDTAKVKLYFTLANEYLKDNAELAEHYCLLGKKMTDKLNYKKGMFEFYTTYSNILKYKGLFDSSLTVDKEALNYALQFRDSAEIGRTMLNVGIAYQYIRDYENSAQYIEKAKDILIRSKTYQYEGAIYNLLQYLYQGMHQYRKGVNSGLKGLKIIEQSTDTSLLIQSYNNLGFNYIQLHIYDSAKYYLKKSKTLAQKNGDVAMQIISTLNFALISLKQLQNDSIRLYASEALALAQKYKIPEYEGLAQYGMAYYYLQTNDYTRSQIAADSALLLASKFNIRDIKQKVFALLSSLYYAKQNTDRGYFYFNEYELISDSILNESIAQNAQNLEKKLETARKEEQIKLQQDIIAQKNRLNYVFAFGALVALIALILAWLNYKNRQLIQQQKIVELESEKQLTAIESILKGEEQERSRLAKDLHDGLGGMLSGIKHSLSSLKENYITTSENAQTLERSIDMLNSSIIEMRRVAHNMMPEILVKYGLNTALQEYCNDIGRSGVININYQSLGLNDISIEQTTAVTIYRIVQELTTNAVKHGEAKNLLVQAHLSAQEKLIALTVEDDGKGFDIASLKNASGIGWNNIQNRVDFLKGRIDINSQFGMGTSVMIEINI